MKNYHKVSVNEPSLFGNEKKYLIKCLNQGFVSSIGPMVEKFEKRFAKKVNKHWYYWCPHTDSNREPTDYKSVALPN